MTTSRNRNFMEQNLEILLLGFILLVFVAVVAEWVRSTPSAHRLQTKADTSNYQFEGNPYREIDGPNQTFQSPEIGN